MKYELTVIVPIFNEEENLERVEKELNDYLKIATKKTNYLLVNDGSTDNSQEIIEQICQKNADFSFIQFQKNAGLSAAIKAGFDYCDTKLVGYIDADLQTSPNDFNLLLESISNSSMFDESDISYPIFSSELNKLKQKLSCRNQRRQRVYGCTVFSPGTMR